MASHGAGLGRLCTVRRCLPRSPSSHRLQHAPTGTRSSVRVFSSSATRLGNGPSGDTSSSSVATPKAPEKNGAFADNLAEYKKYFHFPSSSDLRDLRVGQKVTVHGFLSRRRVKHSKLVFADIRTKSGPAVQVTSTFEEDDGGDAARTNKQLRSIPLHSPVSVTGTVAKLYGGGGSNSSSSSSSSSSQGAAALGDRDGRVDLSLESIQVLNPFPKNIVVSDGVQFPPTSRHLQIRFSDALRQRLAFRSHVARRLRDCLDGRLGFCEYETPLLFKSTPEGAREFIVPTRRRGMAYALPQSPQQYKQLLMASGVGNYYQFARCFRDEDLRADRQPEFTQLDLEMSFATGEDVMRTVEALVKDLLNQLRAEYSLRLVGEELIPSPKTTTTMSSSSPSSSVETISAWQVPDAPFPRMTYEEAMSQYGSDKPDVRIPCVIRRIDSVLPQSFTKMITDMEAPAVEAIRIRLQGTPRENWSFVRGFMDSLPATLAQNPDGAPAVLMFDSSKPLCGLSALGHEGFAGLTSGDAPGLEEFADLQDGDVLFIQAREDKPFQGGSTALGQLRIALYHEAVAKGLLPADQHTLRFLWVHGFPLFTPESAADGDGGPGQGGAAGFSSTHHPFTAPLSDADFELLAVDPLRARADHYDLVVNGIELGGGSRRIHVAGVQEYVLRRVLAMPDDRVAQFAHLLEALRAGCPPHAGFALGFDRLVAVLGGTPSVRDVIAFPKSMRGEDLLVRSPGRVTAEQLETYHLALRGTS